MSDLFRFDGELKLWTDFLETYRAQVQQKPALTNVARFKYLYMILKGEPLIIVREFSLTEENYSKVTRPWFPTMKILSGLIEETCKLLSIISVRILLSFLYFQFPIVICFFDSQEFF